MHIPEASAQNWYSITSVTLMARASHGTGLDSRVGRLPLDEFLQMAWMLQGEADNWAVFATDLQRGAWHPCPMEPASQKMGSWALVFREPLAYLGWALGGMLRTAVFSGHGHEPCWGWAQASGSFAASTGLLNE